MYRRGQEERVTRTKHDAAFPRLVVAYCLEADGVGERAATAVGADRLRSGAVVVRDRKMGHWV